jgi:hypothetical protein
MRQRCKEVGLEPAGKREALKRRLKEHFKNEKLIEAGKLLHYLLWFFLEAAITVHDLI